VKTRHQTLQELLGAYLLGQLGDPEQTQVADHLSGCPSCRAEVVNLEPVVAALRGLDPIDIPSAEEVQLGDQVVRQIHDGERLRRRRTRVRQAASGVLVAASVAAAWATGAWYAGPRTDPPVIDVTLRQTAAGVSADAGLVRHTWGTELKLQASGLTDGASYTVTFVRDDGSRVGAGTFLGTGTRPLNCSVNAALPVDSAAEVMVTDAAGQLVIDADLR
jgi:anti-sigma factor RsiW